MQLTRLHAVCGIGDRAGRGFFGGMNKGKDKFWQDAERGVSLEYKTPERHDFVDKPRLLF